VCSIILSVVKVECKNKDWVTIHMIEPATIACMSPFACPALPCPWLLPAASFCLLEEKDSTQRSIEIPFANPME
jgi:hypothetical protein